MKPATPDAMGKKPALPAAVIEALELLARAWNPPRAAPCRIDLDLPPGLGDHRVNGGYFRGLRLADAARSGGWTGCDLRGSGPAPAGNAGSVRDRLASAPGDRPALGVPRIAAWEGHAAGVNAVGFSPDSRRLASAGDDRVVRLWAVQDDGTARETACLEGHAGWVNAVTFSPDGRRLASAGGDGVVRLETLLSDGSGAVASWQSVGRGLAMLAPDDALAWHLVRADGQPWQTLPDPDDKRVLLPADPLLYAWLWFTDPQWGVVPAFEVPPGWLQWSDDRHVLTVAKAPHDPQELSDWLQAAGARRKAE